MSLKGSDGSINVFINIFNQTTVQIVSILENIQKKKEQSVLFMDFLTYIEDIWSYFLEN